MIIEIPDTNVVTLPVRAREPVDDRMLAEVPFNKCQHLFATFEIDLKAAHCRCLTCQQEVSPMFVLEQLMKQESRWMRTRAAYLDEMKRLDERSRTKCQHCGEMTRISR